ncbi:MAG TPA: hypothetical protein VGO40_14825 [Longimicrobium sp.]|jgi:hypothetical protein|nr:hypothetical protein [Longimicrobium sp.]
MRRLASLLVPVLALSACYNSYRGSGSGPDSYRYSSDRWYDAADVPLAARIDQNGVGLGVRLNRPAYVAMFEILPGQGVGLYYPAFSAEQAYFASGFTMLPTHGARRYDSYFTGSSSRYERGQPRFYFLVASRQPLRSITRFQRSEGAMRSVLGLNAYNTMNYRRVMDDLVQAVVPNQNDNDWTTDVLAVWPRSDYGYYADNGGYQRVYCGDGTVELLPIELAQWGCRRQQRPIVVRQPRVATPTPGRTDSSSVTVPTRRRPEPAAGAPATGDEQGATGSLAPGRRPRPTPEVADRPEVTGGGEPRAATPRETTEERRERPRVETPTREPRAAEPRHESPRHESPRAEPVRSAPPSPPPARSESPRSEPAPRSDPSPSREERARPAAPPAGG